MRKAQPTKAKEPVTIRFKELANGNKSIYLDIYRDGKRTYQFLKLYLVPVKTAFDKANNANALQAANVIKADMIKKIANNEANIKTESNILLSEYWNNCIRKKNTTEATKISYRTALNSILKFRGDIQLKKIDKDYCLDLFSYLCDNMKTISASLFAAKLNHILTHAEKDGIIRKNPFRDLDANEKIKAGGEEREFLTIEEVKLLSSTPMLKTKHDTKNAFLFSCLTGLRLSDIQKLTWGDISNDGYNTRIEGVTKKTKKQFNNSIPAEAVSLLPERKGKEVSDMVFDLPKICAIDSILKRWAKSAGITKNVSFHTARHTFATMLLTQGADLYTVSNLLGHSKVTTTQIYAKIIDKKKDEAMNLLNGIL